MIVLLASVAAMLGFATVDTGVRPAPAPPRVVSTHPAGGARIGPGPFTLSVTFDRPMRGDGYSFVRKSRDSYPQCDGRPALSHDRRTFSLRCSAVAGRNYEIWFNSEPNMNFRSAEGVPAEPAQLLFKVRR